MAEPETPREQKIRNESRRNSERFVNIYLVICSLALSVLIVVVIVLVFRISNVSNANRSNAITACQEANSGRLTDQLILREMLSLPAIASPQFITPASEQAQRIAVAKINQKIATAYAQHDCVAQYSTK
jgi:hypothetical protein